MSEKKVISLDQFRKKKQTERDSEPFYGTLVWLNCPTCDTYEYTEIVSPYGRKHKCGTQVNEIEVEVDFRAEVTICKINIDLIENLKNHKETAKLNKKELKNFIALLDQIKSAEEIYLDKIYQATGELISPYPLDTENLMEQLPVKEENYYGLLLSDFRTNPEKRFETFAKN